MSRANVANSIATEAAIRIVTECENADFTWADVVVTLESTLCIVMLYVVQKSDTPNPEALSQEIIESITERSHSRMLGILRGGANGRSTD
jgi:hypothetical protein